MKRTLSSLRDRRTLVPLLLAATAALAVVSFVGDSLTYDEFLHLVSGVSYLRTGDFRLSPESPPLAKLWAALPVSGARWPSTPQPGWDEGDLWPTGYAWFYDLNAGERLLQFARAAALVWLLGACLLVYAAARTLFGPGAGLLALALAALSPTMLAHGRLVTMDMPMAAASVAAILAFARVLERASWGRVAAAALALSILALVKFSWPVVLPALALMAAIAVFSDRPMSAPFLGRAAPHDPKRRGPREPAGPGAGAEPGGLRTRRAPVDPGRRRGPAGLRTRRQRLAAVLLIGLVLAAAVWLAVWACYGFRYSAFSPGAGGRAMLQSKPSLGMEAPRTNEEAWDSVLRHLLDGTPRRGPGAAMVRAARRMRLLPEAYLYGLAFVGKSSEAYPSYLMGEHSVRGRPAYFPAAFALKTPLAVMLLLAAGAAAIVARRSHTRDAVLLAGFVCFAAVYFLSTLASHMNIGHRHLVPIYPAIFVIAGAAAAWAAKRVGRWLVAAAVVWLVVANASIHPHYLSYFNEIAGGPKRGHLYLADSNIDWGQDLKRLARRARGLGPGPLKLGYFGSADPTRYGFPAEVLFEQRGSGKLADIEAGTYVISVTTLLGVYEPLAQGAFWENPANRAQYAELLRRAAAAGSSRAAGSSPAAGAPPAEGAVPAAGAPRAAGAPEAALTAEEASLLDGLRRGRLVSSLRERPPDERIGYSLFVYRLSGPDVDRLTRP